MTEAVVVDIANKTKANYVFWGLSGFCSLDRMFPRLGEDPGTIPGIGHFSLCWLANYQSSTEISEIHVLHQ